MTDTYVTTTTWAIDAAHSSIEFAVKHMMFATVRGRFADVSGVITLDEDDASESRVEVSIATASVDTRDDHRDEHLRGDEFFAAERHPAITFRSTRVEPRGGNDLAVTGDLQINGVTRQVVLDASWNGRGVSPFGGELIAYSATTRINRKDFGLNWNAALEAGGVLVGDEVRITMDIEALRTPSDGDDTASA